MNTDLDTLILDLAKRAAPYVGERFSQVLAFDTEFDANDWDRLACVSARWIDLRTCTLGDEQLYHVADPRAWDVLRAALEDPSCLVVGLNTAVDLRICAHTYGGIEVVAAALQAQHVGDVMLRELLEALARPGKLTWVKLAPEDDEGAEASQAKRWRVWRKYRWSEGAQDWDPYAGGGASIAKGLASGKRRASMEAIAWRRLGLDLAADKGADSWRLRYGELIPLPLSQWPEEAQTYAKRDASLTLAAWLHQAIKPTRPRDLPQVRWWEQLAAQGSGLLAHEAERVEYAWVLECISRGPGFMVDRPFAQALAAKYAALEGAAREVLVDLGAIVGETVKRKIVQEAAAAIYQDADAPPDLTATGRTRYPDLEGLPIRAWPPEAHAFVSSSGHSVCYALAPQTDDAAALVDDPIAGLGWPRQRVQDALGAVQRRVGATDSAPSKAAILIAAKNVSTKAHTIGGVVEGFASVDFVKPDYNPMLDTGRVSARGKKGGLPQNLSRGGSVRECLRPRPGHALIVADFGSIEMCAFAYLRDRLEELQLEVGGGTIEGPLTKAINAGKDPHILLGLRIMRAPADWGHDRAKALRKAIEGALDATGGDKAAAKALAPDLDWAFGLALIDARFKAKAGNFGYAGGMGPRGFIRAQSKQGVIFTYAEAASIRDAWREEWQTGPYFAFIQRLDQRGQRAGTGISLRVPGSGLHLGGRTYTQASNVLFQGLCAQLLKEAATDVWRACAGLEGPSALQGGRIVHLIHDEIIAEVPVDGAPEALAEMRARMIAPGARLMPGVKLSTSGAILEERWRKC